MAGLDSTLGYEGERPLGMKHAYADICGALHVVFAIVAALYRRGRTGDGCYIDLSMLRATVASMGAGLMEYAMTGRVMQPRGNYDPTLAPYGNYPCRGEDRWVSIAVGTHQEWDGLVEAMARPQWTEDPRFAGRDQRLKHRDQLDQHLAAWTRSLTAEEITETLQSRGVAAVPVMDGEERLSDPHFRERELYSDVEHPSLGVEPIFNLMWKLSRTPPAIRGRAPLLGEHNQHVLGGILGMSQEEVGRLEEAQSALVRRRSPQGAKGPGLNSDCRRVYLEVVHSETQESKTRWGILSIPRRVSPPSSD